MRVAVDSGLPPGRIGDFVIPFDPADTFSDIKEKICAQEGIPVDNHYCDHYCYDENKLLCSAPESG